MIKKPLRYVSILGVCALLALGCGDDSEQLEIVGEYVDNFGSEQVITESEWNGNAIVEYDNSANVVYTQASEDDEFNPGKFQKTVYTDPRDGEFYFCMVEFAADTLADAKASEATADDSHPDESGCGGDFPWTLASKK